jgi:hypothetical protein
MIFKMIVLGHVLLASAFENKALRALQADVDALEKTLKGGDMEKRERTIPPPTLATVYATKSPTDSDGFATVGSDGKQRAELIVQSITPTWTIQGTAITHVCG